MNDYLTILAMGGGIFALRFAGFVAPVSALPDRWKRGLLVLPVVLLSALVASSRSGPASGDPARLIAVMVAGVVAWRYRRIWMVIGAGLGVFWTLRWLGIGG